MYGIRERNFLRDLPVSTSTPTLPRVMSAGAFIDRLELQRDLASRCPHHLSVVLFKLHSANGRYDEARHLALALDKRLRSTDEVGWYDEYHIGVLMPCTSPPNASRVAEEVTGAVGNKMLCCDYALHSYPSYVSSDIDQGTCDCEFRRFRDIGRFGNLDVSASHEGCASPVKWKYGKEKLSFDVSLRNITSHRHASVGRRRPMPAWKRAVDIIGAVFGLLILSPLFLVASILIKTVSKGPVFFKQERIGYKGKSFRMWKFRTYEVHADTSQHQQYVSNLIDAAKQEKHKSQSPMKKLDNADGIIPFGKLLRKSCIDELPQLINVFLGEMSLVGPRPPVAYEVETYADWHKGRLEAVPGMTGLWQVSGKNRLTFAEMVRLDIRYSLRKSLWLDTKILLKTPLAIVSQITHFLSTHKSSTDVTAKEPALVTAE